ncbi:hypothetical protein LR48_Vigan07g031500 [Vigna angularis]|uniref:Uncharacterized protein n=2 Tax=Phaseolus angularis TaxID=3914 RepID=A0A0L9UV54_PHAAN|nr:hypothetical protein LR48_Vigan07g031500 [Vigna angularis]BAT80831.1 hypothetical protein VIGAN_03044200 [Vigna angularis var. angularis]
MEVLLRKVHKQTMGDQLRSATTEDEIVLERKLEHTGAHHRPASLRESREITAVPSWRNAEAHGITAAAAGRRSKP